jgi:hypothetical protein
MSELLQVRLLPAHRAAESTSVAAPSSTASGARLRNGGRITTETLDPRLHGTTPPPAAPIIERARASGA